MVFRRSFNYFVPAAGCAGLGLGSEPPRGPRGPFFLWGDFFGVLLGFFWVGCYGFCGGCWGVGCLRRLQYPAARPPTTLYCLVSCRIVGVGVGMTAVSAACRRAASARGAVAPPSASSAAALCGVAVRRGSSWLLTKTRRRGRRACPAGGAGAVVRVMLAGARRRPDRGRRADPPRRMVAVPCGGQLPGHVHGGMGHFGV